MEKLIQILKSETESLRVQYLEKTKEWAEKHFAVVVSRAKWSDLDWCQFMGQTPETYNKGSRMEFQSFPRGFYNTKASREYRRIKEDVRKLHGMGLQTYLEKETKKAEQHYQASILKLADRIQKKGLVVDEIKVQTAHVGLNINTTLTDGQKTVRAFTIIAEGEIQRPHYRYLVK
jgi:hypothetical protein